MLRTAATNIVRAISIALAITISGTLTSPAYSAELNGMAQKFSRLPEYQYALPVAGSYALPPLKPAPNGVLLDEGADQRILHDVLAGKLSLVSFVYLNCSDTHGCPLAIATLFDIYESSAAVSALRNHMQLVTISFDPARDTPEALASFAYPVRAGRDVHEKVSWSFLTARDEAALAPILTGFGQAVDRSGDQEVINHLLRLFLVDRQGRIRNVYGLGMIDPQLIMTDVETLLLEEGIR